MPDKFQKIITLFFFLFLLLISSLSLWIGIKQIKEQRDLAKTIKQAHVNMDAKVDAILKAFIAEKVEALTKDKNSDEEKVIAIAKWVTANVSNRYEVADKLSSCTTSENFTGMDTFAKPGLINSIYIHFATRSGGCGPHSSIFIEMLKYLNIQAKFYNICCFPARDNAHSCVQVYYD